tara:strand:- start:184 stop:597 length:414 start_codon:yes stop_codon:yes gene_type:complete
VINEDAPTMSAGTGGFSGSANASGPVAGFDPMLGSNNEKKPRLKKKRKYKSKCNEGLVVGHVTPKSEKENDRYLPFKVCYDGAQEYVLYGKSEADIKIQLRKIYRPENHKKIYVKRLYPNQVIKFYYDLRMKALKNQ